MSTSRDRPLAPEGDQRVDVFGERADLRHFQDVVKEDPSLQGAHEEERRGARVADAQPPGGGGAAEVIGDDGKAAARRAVGLVEGKDERGAPRVLVHGDDDAGADDPLGERHELLGDAAEDDARVGVGRRGGEVDDAGRRLEHRAALLHSLVEQGVLRLDVAEERGGGDVELAGDVGEGGGGEALRREDAAGGVEELIAAEARRATHL
jgi:hypothetical protein